MGDQQDLVVPITIQDCLESLLNDIPYSRICSIPITGFSLEISGQIMKTVVDEFVSSFVETIEQSFSCQQKITDPFQAGEYFSSQPGYRPCRSGMEWRPALHQYPGIFQIKNFRIKGSGIEQICPVQEVKPEWNVGSTCLPQTGAYGPDPPVPQDFGMRFIVQSVNADDDPGHDKSLMSNSLSI